MADEYIRLDTTIIGLDGLINEAPTGSQARALLCAKDMIYDQQRYVSEMKPVKRGHWIAENRDSRGYADCYTCSNCQSYTYTYTLMRDCEYDYCPNCGADMRGEDNAKG